MIVVACKLFCWYCLIFAYSLVLISDEYEIKLDIFLMGIWNQSVWNPFFFEFLGGVMDNVESK